MASNDSDSQMKIVHGDAGYILEDVPHFADYIPNLPVFSLSLSLFRSSSITYVNYIAFTHSLADCLCNTFFFCRHIRIRFDPILLTRLLSKLIGLFMWFWSENGMCSVRNVDFSVFCIVRQYFVHMDDTVPQKVLCVSTYASDLFVYLVLQFINLKRFCYVFFCVYPIY